MRRSPGGGNGNPLQYSCPGNPMDRGAWRATVHGVAKIQTRPKRLSTDTCGHRLTDPRKVAARNLAGEIPQTSLCHLTINRSEDPSPLPHSVLTNPSLKALRGLGVWSTSCPVLRARGPAGRALLASPQARSVDGLGSTSDCWAQVQPGRRTSGVMASASNYMQGTEAESCYKLGYSTFYSLIKTYVI